MIRVGAQNALGAFRRVVGGGSVAARMMPKNAYNWSLPASAMSSSPGLAYDRVVREEAPRFALVEVMPKAIRSKRILFLANAHNGMSQALYLKLTALGHQVMVHVAQGEEDMLKAHDSFHPDAIVAPFLTKRVPERLWRNNATCPVLIVHPGVRGDRGVSSIDWALKKSLPDWGVTVLQADEEMDAGDVWKSYNFSVPHSPKLTKSAFYNKLCVPAAVAGVQAALDKLHRGIPPRPLDYSHSDVIGQLEPNMKLVDRCIDWGSASAEQAAQTVRFSDSTPGCPHVVRGIKYRLFGAYPEGGGALSGAAGEMASDAAPGDPIGHRDGAVLFKCADGTGLWISHMKRIDSKSNSHRGGGSGSGSDDLGEHPVPPIKLPATSALPKDVVDGLPLLPSPPLHVPFGERPSTFQEVWVSVANGIAYVHSDFYNGAASSSQCEKLTAAIREVGRSSSSDHGGVKAVLLMGGEHSYGNGINLNTIEASEDPEMESWRNINAINDTIKETFSINDKVVVSVMRGNAGAGGAMAAIASDLVWAHESIIINPHYKTMELTGSEYWTYFLKKRIGSEEAAVVLTDSTKPITAGQAFQLGMVDDLMRYSPSSSFEEEAFAVRERAEAMVASGLADIKIAEKNAERDSAWFERLERHRASELSKMKECFASPWYHDARRRFVYKALTLGTTPPHMHREASVPALPLNGVSAAKIVKKRIKERIATLSKEGGGRAPGLGIVMANGRPDSRIYVDAKIRAAKAVGMKTTLVDIAAHDISPADCEAMVLEEVHALNNRPDIDSIVVQMPLPIGVDSNKVARAIAVHKDADACNPANSAHYFYGQPWSSTGVSTVSGAISAPQDEFRPLACTPLGVVLLLAMHGVGVVGKTAVVVGKSRMVGTPMAGLLNRGGATVTHCDVHTDRATLERKIRNADIVVSAAGRAGLVKGHWIRPGAVVVDIAVNAVGVTSTGKRKVVGDVEYDAARGKASYITPVPGGVGPMTVAMLLNNTLNSFEAHGRGGGDV